MYYIVQYSTPSLYERICKQISYPQMNLFPKIFNQIVSAVLPKRCAGCKKVGTFLCSRCLESIPRAEPLVQSFVTAIFDYRHPIITRAIWRFKYENMRGLAEIFGEKLYEEIIGDLSEQLFVSKNETVLIVPIPLHKKRLRARGYNQSDLLARALLKQDTHNIFELSFNSLTRVLETKPQAKKEHRSARLENLRGAFAVQNKNMCARHVILIDDVATTGATLIEARKTLLAAGAKSVRAYTVAH